MDSNHRVVSYSISTSNHNSRPVSLKSFSVVSYSISTSNHNQVINNAYQCMVVSYSISTSNHNRCKVAQCVAVVVSYSISTSNHNYRTPGVSVTFVVSYSISTSNHNPNVERFAVARVVSYSISTSNHNCVYTCTPLLELYLIPFLHQTTTTAPSSERSPCCILFHFYIKPQPPRYFLARLSVVSYSISTSNHNLWRIRRYFQAHYHLNHILIFNGML